MLVQQPESLKEAPLRPHATALHSHFVAPRRPTALAILGGLWLIIFFASLFAPPLLDDADATHANAARHILLSSDWVTLHVNGIRYLEKAPLPYWLVAISFKLFGFNTFAAHLPQTIGVLLLALLGYLWADKAFGPRTALYTGIAILTSAGVFLFTRVFIPEVLLSLLLCAALYLMLEALEGGRPFTTYSMWTVLALAVLTKGLVALVFFGGATILYLFLSGDSIHWRTLKPFTGTLLFLVIAAPWHILAGLRNTGGMDGHGFFWFYFVNEHFLRFLGKRIPMDYNKLPGYLFWSLHLVWLFPWALFLPVLVQQAFIAFRNHRRASTPIFDNWPTWTAYAVAIGGILLRNLFHFPYLLTVLLAAVAILLIELRRRQQHAAPGTALLHIDTYAQRTTLLLTIYAGLILVFFSFSTNQEYYTFPAYLPLLILLTHALVRAEDASAVDKHSRLWINIAHATFTVLGAAIFAALAYGLWTARHEAFVPDIGDLLAHRGVGDYTLSMSHLFDLTGKSFAALRLPAAIAALAFAFGPALAWILRRQRRHLAATGMLALTSTVFLIAAHIALIRFGPMLSSQTIAAKIQQLEDNNTISRDSVVMLYGDQAFGSSIPFYLGKDVDLVEGRSTSMLFGSTFPDAPPIFLTNADLLAGWGKGDRKLLFVPLEKRDVVDQLLGSRQIILDETSGKALITDRPLR
ncbi:ArnT family glycosyltransferase [Granulicella arctica]|uniref:4-amino-4-deoxy-L-arabinose transferase-like glycosyltransferase n=1 Tax=Granulicella arctica TaxID=940613 RepID=A0A7Y9PKA5_9BACT|nr:glycosyltransferase family 39 protein [Granulicella arctica]NYF81300.1 4-amino-4-deoxy-L-arabinose transferase-like glycosyltransferase [Granulicella arctica]